MPRSVTGSNDKAEGGFEHMAGVGGMGGGMLFFCCSEIEKLQEQP